MKKTRSRNKPISADAIARMADNGTDVFRFFTNRGKVMKPIHCAKVQWSGRTINRREFVDSANR